SFQIAIPGNKNTSLALDGFKDESTDVWIAQCFLQRFCIVVRNDLDAREIRSKAATRIGVRRRRDDARGATVKVARREYEHGLVVGYALFCIAPPPCQLHGRLHSLSATVHKEALLVAKRFAHKLFRQSKLVVVKRARRQRQLFGLRDQRINNPRVAMPLVDRAVSGKEVVIPLSLYVPYEYTLPPPKHHRQRMIVVGTIAIFQRNSFLA